ncbi:MAG: pseudouridine-5'-phosphate glycosidase [Bacteroidales bacterium]|nr:pseudouridine-5'-phosphate glycosidase [Bacteroidales bacterium]
MPHTWLQISDEVRAALSDAQPIVALESTLITHGLPWPTNLETAQKAEAAVRIGGAVPATIAVIAGQPCVGLTPNQLAELAEAKQIAKASRRDLGAVVAQGRSAGTTVSATMALAWAAGIRVFATGGIGGAHRETNPTQPLDISSDLTELSRTPVLVVCAGAKSILDLPQTLELLETFGVPVLGYRTHELPTFYVRGGGGPVSCRVETAAEAAAVFAAHVQMGGKGAILAQPLESEVAVPADEFESAMFQAENEAEAAGISGPQSTPFLLSRLADLTVGRTLVANQALILANARLAAETAKELISQRRF